MPFDGSGNFTRLYNWQSDRDNGIHILAARMDGEFDNFAAGMNVVFFRNGLVPMSGNLSLGQNYINGIGAGSVGNPAVRFADDPTTGLFLNGNNKLGVAVAGTERFEVNNAGVNIVGALNLNGTPFTPGDYMPKSGGTFTDTVRFGNDPNFALYLSGGDPLFVTNPGTYIGYSRTSNVFRHVVNDSTCMTVGAGAVNVSAPLWQNGNQVWHAGNLNPANYAGLVSSPNFVGGRVSVEYPGTGSYAYFVMRTNGVDRGYMAAGDDGKIYFNSNSSGLFTFQKDGSPFGSISQSSILFSSADAQFKSLTANPGTTSGRVYLGNSGARYLEYDGTNYNMPGGGLYVNGSQVWHAGNFNPASYAALSGATFTGNVGGPQFSVDNQFYMSMVSGNPWINVDSGDKIVYNRGLKKFVFNIGGIDVASIDASGNLKVKGSITASTTP